MGMGSTEVDLYKSAVKSERQQETARQAGSRPVATEQVVSTGVGKVCLRRGKPMQMARRGDRNYSKY